MALSVYLKLSEQRSYLPDGLAEELSLSKPSYPAYIGALSSLKRGWCHLSIDVRGDADVTGSNQFPNGSGLGIAGTSR